MSEQPITEKDADELDLANVGLVTLTEGDIEAMRLAVSTVVDEVDVSGLYDAEPDDDIPTTVTSPATGGESLG